jgi:uncharacterized membrane protein YeaQ/YmgE (transglycosylase-associated protein family)
MQHHWYVWLIIGFVAGSLAGRLTGIRAGGCFMTTLVGITGGFIGGIVVGHYTDGESLGFIASTVVAFAFSAVFLGLLRVLGVTADQATPRLGRRW